MSKSFQWIVGEAPPKILAHSKVKHSLIVDYLKRYIRTLTADPRQDVFRLTLVDGFSGGGLYTDSGSSGIVPGSPLLMLQTIREAQVEAQVGRRKPFHLQARYFFVERDPQTFAFLKHTLEQSEFSKLLDTEIVLLQGEFVEE